jgi:hypothetical protein
VSKSAHYFLTPQISRRSLSSVPSEHIILFSRGVIFSPALPFCFQRLLPPVSPIPSPRLQVTEASMTLGRLTAPPLPPLVQPPGKQPQSHRRLLISPLLHSLRSCISPFQNTAASHRWEVRTKVDRLQCMSCLCCSFVECCWGLFFVPIGRGFLRLGSFFLSGLHCISSPHPRFGAIFDLDAMFVSCRGSVKGHQFYLICVVFEEGRTHYFA